MFVYMILNRETGKIYIGKTVTGDLQKYLHDKLSSARTGRYNGRSYLFRSMQKYPSYVWEIFPLISSLKTNEDLCFWERVLIAEYDSQNHHVGYNLCAGGEGFTGSHSEESREKNRQNSLSTWKNPKIRAKRIQNQKEVRDSRGGSFLTRDSIQKIIDARATQDETARRAAFNKWKQTVPEDHFKKIGAAASREDKARAGRLGSKEDKRKAGLLGAANGGVKARHVRWHINRGLKNSNCPLCDSTTVPRAAP